MLRFLKTTTTVWLPVFLVAWVVYVFTCSPSVNGGDSGELMNAIWTLGVAHPPGYPLFTMLAHLFAKLLPFGEVGFRINLFSGFCNAWAAAILATIAYDITKDRFSGWFSGILLAFSPLCWKYSVITEVFGLNQMLVSAFLLFYWKFLQHFHEQESLKLALRTQQSRKDKKKAGAGVVEPAKPADGVSALWMGLCFVAGLGASHHHTSILISAPLLVYGLWLHFKSGASLPKAFGFAVLFGFLGMLPYAYILIAAQSAPKMAWGNTSHWDGFLTHFLRAEYGTLQLGNELTGDSGRVFYRLWHFVKVLPAHTFLGAGVFGLIMAFRGQQDASSRQFLRSAGMAFAFTTVFFAFLANLSLSTPLGLEVQSRFWLLPLVFVSLAAGIGIRHLPQYRKLVPIAAICLIAWGFKFENQHGNRQFENFGVQVLESLPKNALLLFEGDHTFGTLYYAQNVLKVRQDVDVIHMNFLSRPWSRRWAAANFPKVHLPAKGLGTYGSAGYNLLDLIETNRGPGREIFLLNAVRPWDKSLDDHYRTLPWGMAAWVVPKSASELDAAESWITASQQFFTKLQYHWSDDLVIGGGPNQQWENILINDYLNARHNFGVALLGLTQQSAEPKRRESLARKAIHEFEATRGIFEKYYPVFWKNLGLAYRQIIEIDASAKPKLIEAWRNYLKLRKDPDPQIPALEQELRQLGG